MVSGYFRESAKKVAEVREIERKAHRLLYSKNLLTLRKIFENCLIFVKPRRQQIIQLLFLSGKMHNCGHDGMMNVALLLLVT